MDESSCNEKHEHDGNDVKLPEPNQIDDKEKKSNEPPSTPSIKIENDESSESDIVINESDIADGSDKSPQPELNEYGVEKEKWQNMTKTEQDEHCSKEICGSFKSNLFNQFMTKHDGKTMEALVKNVANEFFDKMVTNAMTEINDVAYEDTLFDSKDDIEIKSEEKAQKYFRSLASCKEYEAATWAFTSADALLSIFEMGCNDLLKIIENTFKKSKTSFDVQKYYLALHPKLS